MWRLAASRVTERGFGSARGMYRLAGMYIIPTAAIAIEGRYHLAILPSFGTALEAAASSSVATSPIAIALRDLVDVVKSLWRRSGVNREKGIVAVVDLIVMVIGVVVLGYCLYVGLRSCRWFRL